MCVVIAYCGGAQAGGDGGAEFERSRLRTAPLPSSALYRLCPFAVYGASVGGVVVLCARARGGGCGCCVVTFALWRLLCCSLLLYDCMTAGRGATEVYWVLRPSVVWTF